MCKVSKRPHEATPHSTAALYLFPLKQIAISNFTPHLAFSSPVGRLNPIKKQTSVSETHQSISATLSSQLHSLNSPCFKRSCLLADMSFYLLILWKAVRRLYLIFHVTFNSIRAQSNEATWRWSAWIYFTAAVCFLQLQLFWVCINQNSSMISFN